MSGIIYPLSRDMHGRAVASLHEGLLQLIEQGSVKIQLEETRKYGPVLEKEIAQQYYGDATEHIIIRFQEQHRLKANGMVDAQTANTMNEALGWSHPDDGQPKQEESYRLVGGRVWLAGERPYASAQVIAYHADERGEFRLGTDTTDGEGRYTIYYSPLPGMSYVMLRVDVVGTNGQTLARSHMIDKAGHQEIVHLSVAAAPEQMYHLNGTIAIRGQADIADLQIQVVDKRIGKDAVLTVARTDASGQYAASFSYAAGQSGGKTNPDIQLHIYKHDVKIGESDIRYNATRQETLHASIDEPEPKAPMRTEHELLTQSLQRHYQGRLAFLEENESRKDITYLANKSGWDARAVALASLADHFSERGRQEGADIAPAFYYALFRAGLPANDEQLYKMDIGRVEAIWKESLGKGLIGAKLERELPAALEQYAQLKSRHMLNAPVMYGLSTMKDILMLTLGDDSASLMKFTEIYAKHQKNQTAFWGEIKNTFGASVEQRLKLDGQLSYLTMNNARLMRKLHEASLTQAQDLAVQAFDKAEKWLELIDDVEVPDGIEGDSDSDRRRRYAEQLAAQVRVSYPTQVLSRMVRDRETPLASEQLIDRVSAFLADGSHGFEIGMQPVEQFAQQRKMDVEPAVVQEVKRLQRVYQITARNDEMNVLLKHGADSASSIIRYERQSFVSAFQDELGSEAAALQIYDRARQVHHTVLHMAVSYMTAAQAQGIGAAGAIPAMYYAMTGAAPHADDVIAYPTLESLMGEMDYCSCDHCRSILSPAAYLVDLLQFIDSPSAPAGYENPQTVLLQRRPDIEHLPLTCENTNTPLPYIDIVNETLEYFVARSHTLAGYSGYDTDGEMNAQELDAYPQYVMDEAYDLLAGQQPAGGGAAPLLPPVRPLPFHRQLEELRRYCDKFEIPLHRAMELLRKDDSLERAAGRAYGWRDIWMEQLRCSRAECRLLTDHSVRLQELYGFPASVPLSDALARLSNVKAFTRRMNLTYEDALKLVRTRFINPNAALIPKVERLGISFSAIRLFKEGILSSEQLRDALPESLEESRYAGDVEAWLLDDDHYNRIMELITLTHPDHDEQLCGFDRLEFRYALPKPESNGLRAMDFVRMYRLIRLWRILGWTLEETDKALMAVYPDHLLPDPSADDEENLQRLDDGLAEALPKLGILKRIMDELQLRPKQDLLPLLACFAPIDTHGPDSLYRSMFLKASLPDQEVFADNGYGQYLTGEAALLPHSASLRAAFQLTDDELQLIMGELSMDEETPLALNEVSALYRRGWLARKLKISVQELLLLSRHTGIDPFSIDDLTAPQALRFIAFIKQLKQHQLRPHEALYLLWNEDINGRSAPAAAWLGQFARSLRQDFAAIDLDFAYKDDPEGFSERAKLALLYGNETADRFLGILQNRGTSDVFYAHNQDALPDALLEAAPGIAYDPYRKRLVYEGGVMSEITRDALTAWPDASPKFIEAVHGLYALTRQLFEQYPLLQEPYETYQASVLPEEQRRGLMLDLLLPPLVEQRKRGHAVQAAAAAVKVGLEAAEGMLNQAAVLHAAGDPARPGWTDLTGIEQPGLSAAFYYQHAVPADTDPDRVLAAEPLMVYDADRTPGNGVDALSAVWSGYIEVPENGYYRLMIETDAVSVSVQLDHVPIALIHDGGWTNHDPIELRAGVLYPVTIMAEQWSEHFVLRWDTPGRGREVVPARYLYSDILMDQLRHTVTRLIKADALASKLKLSHGELLFHASQERLAAGGGSWMNRLLSRGTPDQDQAEALFHTFQSLSDMAEIKAGTGAKKEELIGLLREPAAAAAEPDALFWKLTRWERANADVLLEHFDLSYDDLADPAQFARLLRVLTIARKLGVSASAFLAAATNEPDTHTIGHFRAALRARYDGQDWLNVLKPIHDELRSLRRDALVSYILHHMRENEQTAHIDTPDKLFEYFLMDVGMEPATHTSRIRHALSSLQLFIERALMGLEPRVSPSSINVQHWQWMSRYRVWEANRKVFLFPENWLEPELRDDVSPIFKETMSELLQSDLTETSAATALLGYLNKLEEVAKLEPCGMYYDERDTTKPEDNVAHVVARTAGANRKYYYRRKEYGSWTPWELIKLDIEDHPVFPVVWKGRLFLFWLKVMQKSLLNPELHATSKGTMNGSTETSLTSMKLSDIKQSSMLDAKSNTKLSVQAILCWSEYVDGKWQQTKTSDPEQPAILGEYDAQGSDAFQRSKLSYYVMPASNYLEIQINGKWQASFTLYNTHSLPVVANGLMYYINLAPGRYISTADKTLEITYDRGAFSHFTTDRYLTRHVVRNSIGSRAVAPQHTQSAPWISPFFYEDSRHVFYVRTASRVVTIPDWNGYIPDIIFEHPLWNIPELVVPEIWINPRIYEVDPIDPRIQWNSFGKPDVSPIEQIVANHPHIRVGFGTAGTVAFGNQQIGPSGAIMGRQSK